MTRPERAERPNKPRTGRAVVCTLCIAALAGMLAAFPAKTHWWVLVLGAFAIELLWDRWYWQRRLQRAEEAAARRTSWDTAASAATSPRWRGQR